MKFLVILFSIALIAPQLLAIENSVGPVTLRGDIEPLLKEYCVDCHNADKHKGDFNLLLMLEKATQAEGREAWEKVAEAIESRAMPPEKKPQPSSENRELLLKFIDGQLSLVDCKLDRDPGKVEQYQRWDEMRARQSARTGTAPAP